MNLKWTVTDNSKAVLTALETQKKKALESCGLLAEGYAKLECPVDTGNLRNSITHQQSGDDEYIGTNVEYGKYIEFGTGKFATSGGRQTSWRYQRSDGEWVTTEGTKAHPYLKPAVANHVTEYKTVIQDNLKS